MIERSADVLDMASDLQDRMNQDGIALAQRALEQEQPPQGVQFDGLHCVEEDCGVELPPVRIAYKRIRCSACQQRIEDAERRRGRR